MYACVFLYCIYLDTVGMHASSANMLEESTPVNEAPDGALTGQTALTTNFDMHNSNEDAGHVTNGNISGVVLSDRRAINDRAFNVNSGELYYIIIFSPRV